MPYGPYGTLIDSMQVGSPQTVYGFTGEPFDANGLLHLRTRYYDPAMGVFVSLDPLETANRYGYVNANPMNGAVGELPWSNPYAYVDGNPVNRVDRNGLCWEHPNSTETQSSACNQAFVSWVAAVDQAYPIWLPEVSRLVNEERGYWGKLSYVEFMNQWNNSNVQLPSQGSTSDQILAASSGAVVIGGATAMGDTPLPGPADVIGGLIIVGGLCLAAYTVATQDLYMPQRPLTISSANFEVANIPFEAIQSIDWDWTIPDGFSCDSLRPLGIPPCRDDLLSSATAALAQLSDIVAAAGAAIGQNFNLRNDMFPADTCPGGMHWNVPGQGGTDGLVATIRCCPCCNDYAGFPTPGWNCHLNLKF